VRESLEQLAQAHGIAPTYRDIWGREHGVSDETLRVLLGGVGVAAGDDAAIAA